MIRTTTIMLCLFLCLSKVEAHPGIGIVMDSRGNVFYTDLVHVWKISTTGKRSIAVKNVHTHELYMDEKDNLYGEHEWYNGEATDTWGNYVWRLSKNGTFEKTLENKQDFLNNTTLIRDASNNTYWVERLDDHAIIKKQEPKGESSLLSQHQFNNIRWMHYSKSDHNLYVVDRLKIKKVGPTGSVDTIADNLKSDKPPFQGVADHHYIFGIWTDKSNNLYAAIYGAQSVKKITPSGKIATVFESTEGWSPSGGMVSKDGALWIMEFSTSGSTRIRKVDTSGEHTLFGD